MGPATPGSPVELKAGLTPHAPKDVAKPGMSRGSRVVCTLAGQEAAGPTAALHTDEATVALQGRYMVMHIS
jgi:hypothetical protein